MLQTAIESRKTFLRAFWRRVGKLLAWLLGVLVICWGIALALA